MFGMLTFFLPISSWAGLMSVPTTWVKCGAKSNVPCPDPQPTSTARSLAEFFWENAVKSPIDPIEMTKMAKLMNKQQQTVIKVLHYSCGTVEPCRWAPQKEKFGTSSMSLHVPYPQTNVQPFLTEMYKSKSWRKLNSPYTSLRKSNYKINGLFLHTLRHYQP